ncbi:MAG: alpha/beta fold hydrolase [Anaerolineae bacterium]|nr:MAG: alpha/beta fold hydrolase [Anaerolineae bacterium]
MKASRWGVGIVGLALALFSTWQILAAAQGLEITTVRSTRLPLTVIAPEGAARASRPAVLIGHGFAGSGVVMRGFAFSLAHAGYAVVLWDFDGHGANPRPLASDGHQAESLVANAEAALAEAEARGLGAASQVAILGHSMGSGVALAFGQAHPETAATIAVSPMGQTVTPSLPRNLLLMAGSLEAPFVHNAEQRLAEAGGPSGDTADGTARKLLIIPGVEHVSILFSPVAHAAARDWLDATFGPQPGARAYTDRRVLWYGIGVLGALLAAAALAPLTAEPSLPARTPDRPPLGRLAALGGGVLAATLALWLANLAGLGLRDLLGLLVGGYLTIWFGLAGFLSLLLLRIRPARPSRRAVLGGLLAFAALWLGVGLLGQLVWLPWLLIPRRALLWPLGSLLLLPWFLAAAETARGTGPIGRLGWWLGHSAVLAGGLLLALRLSPELGFLILILPLLPIVFGLHALVATPHRGSWPFALSGALFTSWLFLAVFPLQ